MSKCALMSAQTSSRVPSVDIRTCAHKRQRLECHMEVCMRMCNEPKLIQNLFNSDHLCNVDMI